MEKPKGKRTLAQSDDIPPGAYMVAHIVNGEIEAFQTGDYGDASMALPALKNLSDRGIDGYLITNPADEIKLPDNIDQVDDE